MADKSFRFKHIIGIFNEDGDYIEERHFPSINAAKRANRATRFRVVEAKPTSRQPANIQHIKKGDEFRWGQGAE